MSLKIRKVAYSMMTISFIFIMAGAVYTFILGLRQDQNEVAYRFSEVQTVFESFSTNTSLFENYREKLFNGILSNTYYDAFYRQDSVIKNNLSNYEKIVNDIEKNVGELKSLCNDVYYYDASVNTQCSNYKNIYEQVVNYFVGDIKLYNDNVLKYNDYQKSIQSTLFINNYVTNKNYIDYNGDKKYEGKEN